MLSVSDEALHLDLIVWDLYGRMVPYERLCLVIARGQNRGNQVVCGGFYSHRFLFFIGRQLHKILNENTLGDFCLGRP